MDLRPADRRGRLLPPRRPVGAGLLRQDEFDSIASQRSGRDDGGSRANNAVVAQILTEMDGFRPDVPLLVIGTTNRLDMIDKALLRPSRFRAIHIGLPDPAARREIARVHADHFGIRVDPPLLDDLATYTDRFNGDQIRSIFRDACAAYRCHKPPVEPDARQLGFLVGRVQVEMQERQAAERQYNRQAQVILPRGGGPVRPAQALTPIGPAGAGPGRTAGGGPP